MRRPGRKLTEEEAEVWAQVARTVTPFHSPTEHGSERREKGEAKPEAALSSSPPLPKAKPKGRIPPPLAPKPTPFKAKVETPHHLDGSWERRISKGTLLPDFSLDLHGLNLDQAYSRLMHGLTQARVMGARVVLVVTGKPRPVDAMDRGERRGAIRAKISDWLAVSEHASDIVAIRGAHRRHGGQGAVYVVLRRRR